MIRVGDRVVSRSGSQGLGLRNTRLRFHQATPTPEVPTDPKHPLALGDAGTEVTAQLLSPGNLQREIFGSGWISGQVVEGH